MNPLNLFAPHLTMTGRLEDCALLNFRTPAATVRHLVPDELELVTRGDHAFWNVVTCRVRAMRPRHLPAAVGVTYHHVAYRLRVQAMTDRADLTRGLYFIRSDADAALLGAVGNRTTDFRFHRADIELQADAHAHVTRITTADGRGDATFELGADLPPAGPRGPGSCFATHLDAKEWLKYEPLAFAPGGPPHARHLRLAEVHRDETQWSERAVELTRFRSRVFDDLNQTEATGLAPELAVRVGDLDYVWKLGRRLNLLGRPESKTPAAADAVA